MIRAAHNVTGKPWPQRQKEDRNWMPAPKYGPAVPVFQVPPPHQQVLFRSSKHPLSNFFPCDIRMGGLRYRSSEHAYQCHKALCTGEVNLFAKIYRARTGAHAKLLSKHLSLRGESRTVWLQHRVAVMKMILELKYQQVEAFREALSSQDKLYVEATGDEFWGCGIAAHILGWKARTTYPGMNTLGRLMTQLARTKSLI